MKKMRVKNWIPAFAGMTLAMGLAGCEGIGDGNTLRAESLRITPAKTFTQTVPYVDGGTYKLFQCLRDELRLDGEFDDGTLANFNNRATWTSSDPLVVRVSNGDIPVTTITQGEFSPLSFLNYVRGTVIPVGAVGAEATISATYLGLTRTIKVVIQKPTLKIVPVPFRGFNGDPFTYSGTSFQGAGTVQRFTVVGNFDGRILEGADVTGARLNSLALNPVLWKFTSGEFQVTDTNDATIFDNQWVAPSLLAPEAGINSAGELRGVTAGVAHAIEAQLSLCLTEPAGDLRPTATIQVLPFASTDPLTLGYEADFHDPGTFLPQLQFSAADQVVGTNQILQVVGRLDNGGSIVEQYLGNQVAYNFEPKDGTLTPSSLFSISNGDVLTATSGTTGRLNDGFDPICLTTPLVDECLEASDPNPDSISLEACFPLCAPRLASLRETGRADPVVDLKATAIGIAAPQYIFNCGDGNAAFNNGTDAATCDYATAAGPFTATVRILGANNAVTVNTGAVRINLAALPDIKKPTTRLTASPTSGRAPLAVTLFASPSTVPDTGDSVRVYEFHPDATNVISQTTPSLVWVYTEQPTPTTEFPFVRIYDGLGRVSVDTLTAAPLDIDGIAALLPRSTPLALMAQPATPCVVEIDPPVSPPALPTETAFTFPGLKYEAVASFAATAAGCNTDPMDLIGTQRVTRFVNWFAKPDAATNELSDFVTLQNSRDDFRQAGQLVYLQDPQVECTTVAITGTPRSNTLFADVAAPAASTLRVQRRDPAAACQ